MKKKLVLLGVSAMVVFVLSGCGINSENPENTSQNDRNSMSNASMNGMNHSSSGDVPVDLNEATNPTFQVGSQAIINAEHMAGMSGAKAMIVGAYSTTAYSVSYTPTTGGEKVTDHKWVIHEEIKNAAEKPYQPGEEVVLQADHMNGMNEVKATIDSAEQTTVYMVDYTSTTDGEKVINHKWVTESELSSVGLDDGDDMAGMKH
ncbi:MAG: YdhK family protein [Candidatus Pristimantibacillus sp.]